MTHPQQYHKEQSSSFTITQIALGSPLQFEPVLGSQELDNLINNYVPGSAMPQQKRAQVVLEFLNSIDALSYTHPVSIRYRVPQVLTPQVMPRHTSMPSITAPSSGASQEFSIVKEETLTTSKSSGSLKRSREEAAPPNASSAKRLPGFSIMTKDGIDITDLASRGPKTKEQRDHAALMRKLKACAACKRSKQRCDPSHHRPAEPAQSTSSAATPSSRSARLSCISSAGGSRGSISPQSSLGESFSQSPTQSFVDRATIQTGQCFPPLPITKPSPLPSDFTLPGNLLTDSDLSALPMQDFDPEIFQFADMELDSWNVDFTTFPPVDGNNAWKSHEDIFAPNYEYTVSPVSQGVSSSEQVQSSSLPHVATFAEHVLTHQDQERQARQTGHLVRDAVSYDSRGLEFDIDQWLHSTTDREDRKGLQSQQEGGVPSESSNHSEANENLFTYDILSLPGTANFDGTFSQASKGNRRHRRLRRNQEAKVRHVDMFKRTPFQPFLQNPIILRDQDYILYPDSPQFDWGLEPHQISRDIGSKEWHKRTGTESATSEKRHVDAPCSDQKSQGPTSTGLGIPGSGYRVSGVQRKSFLEAPDRYLPSPSPSNSNASYAESAANDMPDYQSVVNNAQNDSYLFDSSKLNHYRHVSKLHHRAKLDEFEQQPDVPVPSNYEADRHYSVVRRTRLNPSQPHNLRPVITADVDVGCQSQTDQFARSQVSSMDMTIPDVQDHTMDFLSDSQAQETLMNRDPKTLMVNPRDWDHIWKERDLRRAGLLGVPIEGNHTSQLRVSRHDMAQAHDTASDVCDTFTAEGQRQSWRTTMSSDLSGEDGNKYFSIESLTQHRLVLSQSSSQQNHSTEEAESHRHEQERLPVISRNMTMFMTLCVFMTISLLWTILLLMAVGNDPSVSSIQRQSMDAIFYSWNVTAILPANSRNDEKSLSVWHDYGSSVGHDYGSPCQSDPGPGPDQTTSMLDFFHSGSNQINYIQFNHILDSRPESESETSIVDDNPAEESFSDQWRGQASPFPTFSSASGTPTFMTAPSTMKCAPTWTTHLPARSTLQPREAHPPVTLQSQRQSPMRSPSSRILIDLKRILGRHFSIGHLSMRITSLTVI